MSKGEQTVQDLQTSLYLLFTLRKLQVYQTWISQKAATVLFFLIHLVRSVHEVCHLVYTEGLTELGCIFATLASSEEIPAGVLYECVQQASPGTSISIWG